MREVVRRNRVATGSSISRSRAAPRAATTAFPRRRRGRASSSPPVARSPAERGARRRRRPGGHAAATSGGRIRTSRRCNFAERAGQADARARRGRSRPGSSTQAASSPTALRPTRGSSTKRANSSPARPIAASSPASTRATLIEVAAALGVALQERPFTPAEAYAAREAFLSSATTIVLPVVAIDGRAIGDGRRGRWRRRCGGAFTKSPRAAERASGRSGRRVTRLTAVPE